MLIKLKNVTHIYEQQNVMALDNINLQIDKNEFIGLVGHTGSGKSTLVQLFNGLITPSDGEVFIDGIKLNSEKVNLKDIRRKIGLVFQYPEHQLFEETVYEDIAFGPKNLNLSKEKIDKRVKEAMELVNLDFEEFNNRSPFNLSGGQQRRVAIAGVLAMGPDVLILDEPSAGLDPKGRERLTELLYYLHQNYSMTIILISHRMEEIARLSNRVIVLDEGKIVMDNHPRKIFSQRDKLQELGLDLPEISLILNKLQNRGLNVRTDLFKILEAKNEILTELRSKKNVN
ncbi:MAG TPA: energy-coupling factor transporter ATPase [Halanaerobiales bacterium]|nr:energy-coupling factor transporter ATPase [Halanaerobiales bacterium]